MAYCKIAIFFCAIVVIGGLFESAHGDGHLHSTTDKIEGFIKDENLSCENYKQFCAQKGEEVKNLPKDKHTEIKASLEDIVSHCETFLSAFLCDHDDYGKE